eukprot:scaffold142967_cov27-Attheya_sp.AAC.2
MLEAHSNISAVVDTTNNAITSQSLFECFVLQHMRETAYGCWLVSISEQFDSNAQPKKQGRQDAIAFLVPSTLAVTTWADHMNASTSSPSGLKGRGNRSKTIETRIGGLSTTTKQGGQHTPFVGILIDKLKFYKEEERDIPINEAPAFDIGQDLPVMYKAYSPKWEDVQYPDCFDSDVLPPWVILKLTNWKQKKSVREGGPIFGHAFGTEGTDKNSVNYRNALKHMFVVASKIDSKFEHLAKCSSHSIRRTFAQWADTCGLDIGKIMSIGRWRDIITLKRYVDDNQNQHIRYISLDANYQPKGFDFFRFTTKCFVAKK